MNLHQQVLGFLFLIHSTSQFNVAQNLRIPRRIFQWFPTSLRITSKLLTIAYEILHNFSLTYLNQNPIQCLLDPLFTTVHYVPNSHHLWASDISQALYLFKIYPRLFSLIEILWTWLFAQLDAYHTIAPGKKLVP